MTQVSSTTSTTRRLGAARLTAFCRRLCAPDPPPGVPSLGIAWTAALALSALLLASPAAPCLAQNSDATFAEAGIYFVPDVEDQFAKLALRPEALGFDIGSSPNPSQAKHYQGIVRKAGPGVPYFFVSRSGNCPGFFSGCQLDNDNPGNLLIVKMASRDTDGERLRSNRFRPDSDMDDTRSDPRDTTVAYLSYDGGAWPEWGHPGGMQQVGDILAVPLETFYQGGCSGTHCETGSGSDQNVIHFLDISNPESPVLKSQLAITTTDDWTAGLVGMTPVLNDDGACCNYLLLVTGAQGKVLATYTSVPTDPTTQTTDLADPGLSWTLTDVRTESEIESCITPDWHTGVGDSHQTLNFVREGSLAGALYLIGARNTTLTPGGDDWLDLYLFDEDAVGDPAACLFTHVDSTHFTSKTILGGGDSANFAAAGGVYVSPSGELLFYSSEYDNDGPSETVRVAEYRHREVVRSDSPTLRPSIDTTASPYQVDEGGSVSLEAEGRPPLTKAWMTLYEDDDLGNDPFGDSDDWLHADYVDWHADDFDDFRKEDFSDDAGSWRWFAPVGCTLRANDDDFGDDNFPGEDTKTLHGTGMVEAEPDLDSVNNDQGDPSMDDAITSMQFFSNCDTYYGATMDVTWDLDDDGIFESLQPAFFSAVGLDGPSEIWVQARAEHPLDATALGIGDPVDVEIEVLNVAPTLDPLTDLTSTEGLQVSLAVGFFDPGAPDTHTATIDWGDEIGSVGASVSEAANATDGTVTSSHTYGDNGVYTVSLCVEDDDGGQGCGSFDVTVANAAPTLSVDTASQVVFPGGGAAFLGRRGESAGFSAGGSDAGSDDLDFSWQVFDTYFGGTIVHTDSTYYCNDPTTAQCPDPLPSSQVHHFPMAVNGESTTTTPALPGVFQVDAELEDDDSGSVESSLWWVVTDDRECRENRSFWRREVGDPAEGEIGQELLERYLHVVEFASANLSERFCATLHDTDCLRTSTQELLSNNSVDLGDGDPARRRAKALAEVVAAWLNFASGAIAWDEEIASNGESFHERMARLESLILDPTTSKKDLVDARSDAQELNHNEGACP